TSDTGPATVTCSSTPIDVTGMTPCINELSARVQKLALGCDPLTAEQLDLPTGSDPIPMLAASSCAGLDSGKVSVVYLQYASLDQAAAALDAVASQLSLEEREWHSDAGSGLYLARTYDRIP